MKIGIAQRVRYIGLGIALTLTILAISVLCSPRLRRPALRLLQNAPTERQSHREERMLLFSGLPAPAARPVVLIGDSLIEGGAWFELFGASTPVINLGISGDTVSGVGARADAVTRFNPKVIVILVGINDLLSGTSPSDLMPPFENLVRGLRQKDARVFIHGILPVNATFNRQLATGARQIEEMNRRLRAFADAEQVVFVDIGGALSDADGRLSTAYTNDGLHLSSAGYLHWCSILRSRLPQVFESSVAP